MFYDIHRDYKINQQNKRKYYEQAKENQQSYFPKYFEEQIQQYSIVKSAVVNLYPFLMKDLKESVMEIKSFDDRNHLKTLIYLRGQFKGFIENEDKNTIKHSNLTEYHLNRFIENYLDIFLEKIEMDMSFMLDDNKNKCNAIVDLYRVLTRIKLKFNNRINKCQKRLSIIKWIQVLFNLKGHRKIL